MLPGARDANLTGPVENVLDLATIESSVVSVLNLTYSAQFQFWAAEHNARLVSIDSAYRSHVVIEQSVSRSYFVGGMLGVSSIASGAAVVLTDTVESRIAVSNVLLDVLFGPSIRIAGIISVTMATTTVCVRCQFDLQHVTLRADVTNTLRLPWPDRPSFFFSGACLMTMATPLGKPSATSEDGYLQVQHSELLANELFATYFAIAFLSNAFIANITAVMRNVTIQTLPLPYTPTVIGVPSLLGLQNAKCLSRQSSSTLPTVNLSAFQCNVHNGSSFFEIDAYSFANSDRCALSAVGRFVDTTTTTTSRGQQKVMRRYEPNVSPQPVVIVQTPYFGPLLTVACGSRHSFRTTGQVRGGKPQAQLRLKDAIICEKR